MKFKWVILSVAVLAGAGVFTSAQLKSDAILVSASYQKLACEKCYHMTVEKSADRSLVGETIIPVSKTVNIEKMIDGVALNNAHLCLRGQLYKFNINIFKIDPDGKRFQVVTLEKPETCASI